MNAYINNRKWYFPILFFRFISKGIFIFCLFLLFSCVFKSEAYANTYYVDASITDTNPTSATPDFATYNPTTFEVTGGSNSVYKTIADVNLKSFSPGDNIYFRRGQTWNEQLTIAQSGTVVNRITFGAYGLGNKPIIDAQNTRNYAITTLVSFNYVTIQDIQVQNGTFANIWFDNSTSGLILNNLTSESGVRGIWIRKASNATYTKITANNSTSNCFYIGQLGTNVTINDINASGCSGYPAIYIYQLTDVVATNLTAINNYNGGIQFLNNVGNVTVSNSVSTGNTGIGVELLGNVSGNSVNYLLDNIISSYNSTKGFDIQLLRDGAVEVLIDNSLSEHNGDNGIELDITKNITIQNSIIRYNSLNGIGAWYTANDNISIVNCKVNNNLFDGVSFHGSSSGVLVERCESYSNGTVGSNNSGDGYTSHETVILKIHNSIAHDNLNSGVAIINATAGEVFNSTFYNNGSVGFSRGGYWSEVSGGTGWIVKNNIFSNNYPYEFFTDSTGINYTTADNNLYYHPADNKVATLDAGNTYKSWDTFHTINGYQPNSVYADPLFLNIAILDFRLNRLSPAINAGTNVGLTTDYIGTSVPQGSSPDIGAYEYIPLTVTINKASGQSDTTLGTTINFTATFSEPVTDFQTGDVNITGTAGATTATITGSGTTYNIAVTGMTHVGTVIVNIPADVATGSTENTNEASTSTDNQVIYNILMPVVDTPVIQKIVKTYTTTHTSKPSTEVDTTSNTTDNTDTTITPVDNTKTTEVKENTKKKNPIPVWIYIVGGGIIIGCILLGIKYIKKGREER